MHESPIRVLLWSPRGSGEHYNGPASFTYRLYSNAPKGRVAVTLAHGAPGQDSYSLFEDQHYISDLGTGVFDLPRFVRRGMRWLDEHAGDFDVMHSISTFNGSMLPSAYAQKIGIPTVMFVSIQNFFEPSKKALKKVVAAKLRQRYGRKIAGLVAMSQSIFDELVACGIPEERIARIPMGVDTTTFHPADSAVERKLLRDELGWLDLPTVIFVGAMVQRKQPHLLIEALGILKQRGLDCQLVLVGPESDSAYTTHMKSRASELNVADQVVWFGFTQDIARLFRAADVFSLPSTNEGMSASLIEAMASGLPPIATPISGSVDAVQDGVSGRLVHGKAPIIADVLADYVRSPQLVDEHGLAARQRVMQHYSNERVFDAYDRMFRRLMAGGTAAE